MYSYVACKTKQKKTNKINKPKTHRNKQWFRNYQRKKVMGERQELVKEAKHTVIVGDLILGGERTMQYAEDLSEICTLKDYIINQCHPNNFNKIKNIFYIHIICYGG